MRDFLICLACVTWLMAAILNTIFIGKELKPTIRKRQARLAGGEPERLTRILVVSYFLLAGPYLYIRYTAKYMALDLVSVVLKWRIRREERRQRKTGNQ